MTRRAHPRGPLAVMLAATLALMCLAAPALADPSEEDLPAHAYAAEGQEVSGGHSLAQAPLVGPGVHLDSFESGAAEPYGEGTTKYYRVAVEDGQRVRTAATIAAPPYPDGLPTKDTGLGVEITYLTAGGETCDEGGTDEVGETYTGDGPITATRVSGVVGPDGCTGTEMFVQVTRSGVRSAEDPLPLEIQIAIQPAGIGGGSPVADEEIEDSGAAPVAPENTDPLELGRSFPGATEVEPGSYLIELVPGETGMLRIPVQEGQRLRWRTEVTSQPEDDAGSMALRVFDASRSPVTVGGGSWLLSSMNPVSGGGMAAPVDLGNRSSEIDAVQSAWLPGTHTVQLQRLQREANADPAGDAPITVILTLEVEGEVADDAAEGTVLELGDTTSRELGGFLGLGGLGRTAMFVGAGLLTLTAGVTGIAGVLVLRLRRR